MRTHPGPGSTTCAARVGVAALALSLAGCIDAQPCLNPLQACGNTCYDLQSEPQHCGACGHACASGDACVAGACVPNPEASCRSRVGGAFVTLVACGQSVKLWATDPVFIARAQALLAEPASPGAKVPQVRILLGPDCDDQWSWHPSFASTSFVPVADEVCNVCPYQVESNTPYYVQQLGRWCPGDGRVTAVDVRAPLAATTSE